MCSGVILHTKQELCGSLKNGALFVTGKARLFSGRLAS